MGSMIIVLLFVWVVHCQERIAGTSEADSRSVILVNAINDYRDANGGLSAVAYSPSLSFVAQHHVDDSDIEIPAVGECNLHSWSDNGPWTGMCYTSDHAEAANMWNKPGELTLYTGSGYEISVGGGYSPDWESRATECVNSWDSSQGHKDVILNQDIWTSMTWRGVGCAMSNTYCHCWFGTMDDPGRDFTCADEGGQEVDATDETVCSGVGVGICKSEDQCICFPGYIGDSCQNIDDDVADDNGVFGLGISLFCLLLLL